MCCVLQHTQAGSLLLNAVLANEALIEALESLVEKGAVII